MIIGEVAKAQGIKGELKLNLTIEADRVKNLEKVEINGKIYAVEKLEKRTNGVFVKLEGVDDRTTAENMRGLEIEVDRSALESLNKNEFYFEDLIGAKVVSESGEEIGTCEDIEQYGAADVLLIRQNGILYSLPFLDDIFLKFNEQSQLLVVNKQNYDAMKIFD